jgi:hypothetical protein
LAPLGTVTVIEVALHAVGWAAIPLKVTVLAPCVAAKFTPLIVTAVPTGPAATDRLEILGPVGSGAFTLRVKDRICVRQPLVPVAVSVYVPGGVDVEVVTFRVELPAPANEAGVKVAVAPVGNPLKVNVAVPAKPFTTEPERE